MKWPSEFYKYVKWKKSTTIKLSSVCSHLYGILEMTERSVVDWGHDWRGWGLIPKGNFQSGWTVYTLIVVVCYLGTRNNSPSLEHKCLCPFVSSSVCNSLLSMMKSLSSIQAQLKCYFCSGHIQSIIGCFLSSPFRNSLCQILITLYFKYLFPFSVFFSKWLLLKKLDYILAKIS